VTAQLQLGPRRGHHDLLHARGRIGLVGVVELTRGEGLGGLPIVGVGARPGATDGRVARDFELFGSTPLVPNQCFCVCTDLEPEGIYTVP
jgi:hypothetical protein